MATSPPRRKPAPRAARPGQRTSWGQDQSSRRVLVDAAVAAAIVLVGLLVIWYLWGPRPMTQTDVASSARTQPTTTTTRAPRPTGPSTALPVIAAPQTRPHVQAGRQMVLRSDVLFAPGSAALTDSSKATLVQLAQSIAAAHLHGTIQINGYTDNTGSVDSNVALSLARALAVARVLQAPLAGQAVTLVPQGFGQASPVASNSTAEGQASNRRVTIVLPQS